MNTHNFSQLTNYIAGSDKFKHIPLYLTSVNIPGISFAHPEIGGKHSSRLNITADTYTWNSLSFEVLIDENFKVYKELMKIINSNIRLDGTFSDFTFDFWIEVSNNKGNKVLKIDFSNCRITSIGDIELNSQDESTEHTLTFDVIYDFYEIEETKTFLKR